MCTATGIARKGAVLLPRKGYDLSKLAATVIRRKMIIISKSDQSIDMIMVIGIMKGAKT
jgi:hypothetical protein